MTEPPGPPTESVDQILDAPSPPVASTPEGRVFRLVGADLFEAIQSHPARKVVLQVPAGLTRNAHRLAAQIREATAKPVVLATRACFGACDFPSDSEAPGAELAVVLGHAPIPNVHLTRPTFFVEMREPGGDPRAMAELVERAGLPRSLGIVASVQHLDLLPEFSRALEERGYRPRTGTGDHRLAYAAQALGCNYSTAESIQRDVEAFLFVGTGRFHPLGLAFAVDRPVWALDPLQELLEQPIDREALIRRRQLLVASVRDARRWGILTSSFAGQDRHPMALALQRRAARAGREAEILVFDRLDPRDLEGRDMEAYVNTACPRIALDDSALYPRPLLTPPEFLMALGELPLAPYRFDTYR
ncbi:MAG TPA: diphthamide biosynthesis enzyme Dph2 [Thermoplasmata archaeon]|nr:diphthamide biosynthesis enzyme Dph2 [Thermoplasmata archaeon]